MVGLLSGLLLLGVETLLCSRHRQGHTSLWCRLFLGLVKLGLVVTLVRCRFSGRRSRSGCRLSWLGEPLAWRGRRVLGSSVHGKLIIVVFLDISLDLVGVVTLLLWIILGLLLAVLLLRAILLLLLLTVLLLVSVLGATMIVVVIVGLGG